MKTLIITAHPSSKGFTHQLAEKYAQERKDQGNTAEILDLYKNPQDYLNFEERHEMGDSNKDKLKQQKLIQEADELVFIFPVWWGDCPAIMKNWFDVNMTSGFAYTFENGKIKKLLAGKKASVICTAGAKTWLYRITGMISGLKKIWKYNRLDFCGIKLEHFIFIGDFGSTTHRDEKKALDKINKLFK